MKAKNKYDILEKRGRYNMFVLLISTVGFSLLLVLLIGLVGWANHDSFWWWL